MNRVLNGYFAVIEDYMCQCDVKHRLTDILTLVMCAVLCGIDELSEIVDYGTEKAGFLKEVFGVESIPSCSTLTRVMNMVDAEKLSVCIVNIMREVLRIVGNTIAIDGKTIRSTQRPSSKSKLHIVTAYLTENGVGLGQMTVGEKTNEIPVVRELIGMLDIKGKTLTLDAMHCQKETAQVIVSGGGDYVLGLKGNQKLLHNDIELYMNDCMEIKDILVETASTSEKNKNRFEERTCRKAPDISWLYGKDEWARLKNIYSIHRKTIVSGNMNDKLLCNVISIVV
jgi:predicted transposase YbfD/YdcC